MSRLLNLDSAKGIQKNRLDVATQFVRSMHKQLGNEKTVILVLKGSKTIVSDYGTVYINHAGNPGMATAGAGDVLTGIIVPLIGQGLREFDALQLGAYIHGLVGNMASRKKGEVSMIATDILDFVPNAFLKYKTIENDGSVYRTT